MRKTEFLISVQPLERMMKDLYRDEEKYRKMKDLLDEYGDMYTEEWWKLDAEQKLLIEKIKQMHAVLTEIGFWYDTETGYIKEIR